MEQDSEQNIPLDFPQELKIPRELRDAFFRGASSNWGIWRNHAATIMPSINPNPNQWPTPFSLLSSLFQLFCVSQERKVSMPQKKQGAWKIEEYSCPPLTVVLYPDSRAGPVMRTPKSVLTDMTGTPDELALTFVSFLRELGCDCEFSIVSLALPSGSRYAAQIGHAGNYFYADLVGGLLIRSTEEPACYGDRCEVKNTDILGLIALFAKGRPKGPYAVSSARISSFYSIGGDMQNAEIRSVFKGQEEISLFWHFQSARRLAQPLLNTDVLELAASNPSVLESMVRRSTSDFSQAANHLSEAMKIYSALPEEGKARHATLAGKIRAAITAIENAKKK